MKKLRVGDRRFYQFDNLLDEGVLHFSSTKGGWAGDGRSRFTGDAKEEYVKHRETLAVSFGLNPKQLVFPRQTHSDRVAIVHGPIDAEDIPDTDAVITNQPGVCICVQSADCVPLLIFDPEQQVVAAVHAGWRGTVRGIAAKTVGMMQEHFASNPQSLRVGIGPSISNTLYEVGEDVIHQVQNCLPQHEECLFPTSNPGKAFLDLWQANKILLTGCGVLPENIEVAGLCTYSGLDNFYSARRDGAATGRMVSGIMLI